MYKYLKNHCMVCILGGGACLIGGPGRPPRLPAFRAGPGRSACLKKLAPPNSLSSLWSRWRVNWPPVRYLCVRTAVLVLPPQTVWTQELSPSADEGCFDDWWSKVNNLVDRQMQKGLNSLIILGACSLWKYRNRCVFDGMAPNLGVAWMLATEELHLWMLAGAWGMSCLSALAHVEPQ